MACITSSLYNMPWQSHVIAFFTSYNAFNNNTNIAKKMELEYMVRLFSERQISTIINSIAPRLYEDRHIVIIYSRSGEHDDILVNRVAEVVRDTVRGYGCRLLDWGEPSRKPVLHPIEVLGIFKHLKDVDIRGLERHLDEILIGVSGCNSVLIE